MHQMGFIMNTHQCLHRTRLKIKSSRFCKPLFAGFNSQNFFCTYVLSKVKLCVLGIVNKLLKTKR